MGDKFLESVLSLPKKVQAKAMTLFNKLRADHKDPSLNFEAVEGAVDPKMYAVRIDYTYRCIISYQKNPTVFILLWADHHDEAFAWAQNKKCNINIHNGSIQIFKTSLQIRNEGIPVNPQQLLFANLSNHDLLELGVPEEQIVYVRSFSDTNDFYVNAKNCIPDDAYEALGWILEDIPVVEVIDMVKSAGQTHSINDMNTALECPLSMKNFVVIDSEDELKSMMDKPLEKWRVFLHPTQRKNVIKEFNGPARVLGGAGTGKTVVAMHRARYLAKKLCEAGGNEKILFTTFSVNLVEDIKGNLRGFCSKEELKHIEVVNIDAWVSRFLLEKKIKTRMLYDNDEINKIWDEAILLSNDVNNYSREFYIDEWNSVVTANDAYEVKTYMTAPRNGRGTALDRKKRLGIWKVFENYLRIIHERNVHDINYAMYKCRNMLSNNGHYAHIIVDEGQDLSNSAYRLIRSIAGKEHKNDIFIVGDSHQRIFKNKPVLSKCGINIRGRSSTLKINYRTTEEIRRYAISMLTGISFDDLDNEEINSICQSLTHGNSPEIKCFDDYQSEIQFIREEIQKLINNGVELRDICIVARTNSILAKYGSDLNYSFVTYDIKTNEADDRNAEALRLATMHRIKGLEFQYIFIAGANDGIIPLKVAISNVDALSARESLNSERSLLYVALTRAQKAVYVTGCGTLSKIL